MACLKISVNGHATIPKLAERAVLSVGIASEGSSKEWVVEEVTTSTKHLRNMLEEMSPMDDTEEAKQTSKISDWSMTSLQTTSHMPTNNNGEPIEGATRVYEAEVTFDIRFRDFEALGPIATKLAAMPHVQVDRVDWILTPQTEQSYLSELRKMAARDALQRARDYAEALGLEHVVAVELEETQNRLLFSSAVPRRKTKQSAPYASAHQIEKNYSDLAFHPEEIKMNMDVMCKFQAE